MQDNLLCGIDEHDFQDIRESVIEQIKRNQIVLLVPVTQETCQSSKRWRFDEKKSTTYCIICSKSKCKSDTKFYTISEHHRAKILLLATRFFKDDVQTRCIFLKIPGDVFVADVMYHKNCLSGYVLKFRQGVELIMR